ncbi:hypothetical protein K2224_31915 (plasmid) [Streptomyces sp. BHT-5-2]|uniref:hypothetical protein n=1 Tax=Streptomyces sp. BHT-5-2 TaxID=2866715 RepID=UPI001C8D8A33|nr:hypothetical protein [Streptomyces sp. BHT-5-2]QZL07821.1 hypothetical protein K2224_31915 [Streptomyces sp. BHT-5-2]
MAIRVLRGMKQPLRGGPTVVVLVRSGAAAEALAHALRAVTGDLTARFVSEPAAVPGGMLLMVDFGEDVPPAERERLPDALARRLAEAGVTDAEIGPAPRIGDRYTALDRFVPVARAWLLGRVGPGAPLVADRPAPALVDLALSWLRAAHRDGHQLLALVVSTEIPLTWRTARPVVDAALDSHGSLYVLSTDFATGGSVVGLGEFHRHGLTLGTGGTDRSPAELAAALRRQRDLLRAGADALDWACAGIYEEDRFFLASHPHPADPRSAEPRPRWYQILSPERLALLDGPPEGGNELPGGRLELTSGSPEDWLTGYRGG